MIGRIWHGYTTPENGDIYEQILLNEVIPGIEAMNIEGYHGIKVLRRSHDGEIEFITIIWFDSLDNVKAFTGEDYERAHVPDRARAVLKRFDNRAQHYDLLKSLTD